MEDNVLERGCCHKGMQTDDAYHDQDDNQTDGDAQQPTAHGRIRQVRKVTGNEKDINPNAYHSERDGTSQQAETREENNYRSGCEADRG